MIRELGHLMPTLVQARSQVWLTQSPLTDTCQRVLRSVSAEPGEPFGPAALEALKRTAQAGKTRQQLAGLQRSTLASSRPRTSSAAPRRHTQPSAFPSGHQQSQQPVRDLLALRPLQRCLNGLHLNARRHRHRKVKVSQQCILYPCGERGHFYQRVCPRAPFHFAERR